MANVVEFRPPERQPDDLWRRRLALQIAVQLPENPEDALAVLEHAKTLVRSFMTDCRPV